MAGIVGWGTSVPRFRVKVEEIAQQWGQDAASYKKGLMLQEKSVPGHDQDTITISVEAARYALDRAPHVNPKDIGAIYIGSESHPYAVKPSGVTVAEAIDMQPNFHTADLEFACKAGSQGMFLAYCLVDGGKMPYAFGIGADTSQGAPANALEYSASAGGAAFLFGNDKVVATVDVAHAYATDTPDFWRREHEFYPQHGGRFTGEPAYFHHVMTCARAVMEMGNVTPQDLDYAVFHMPNGKFPMTAGKKLGFKREQIEPGWVVPILGNTYSGASPMGLASTLEIAKPGNRILMVSFGSGAGSDGFLFTVTDEIEGVQARAPKLRDQLADRPMYLTYGQYAAFRGKIRV